MTTPLGSRYELIAPIASGATGTVWRARVRTSGELVAAKEIKAELATDADVVDRFLRERRVLASVRHPAVVRLLDLVVEGDRIGLIMDLVEGVDLRTELVRSGPFAPGDAVEIAITVADALAAAHAAGVVHADVKPGNVLVPADGGAVRLADFGVARLVRGPAPTSYGTPEYIAPEVVLGHAAIPASDVYGLGIMLYELLTGTTPYRGGTAAEVMRRHVSARPLWTTGVPLAIRPLLRACLDRDAGARPSAVALAADLRDWALGLADYAAAVPLPAGTPHFEEVAPEPARPVAPDDSVTSILGSDAPTVANLLPSSEVTEALLAASPAGRPAVENPTAAAENPTTAAEALAVPAKRAPTAVLPPGFYTNPDTAMARRPQPPAAAPTSTRAVATATSGDGVATPGATSVLVSEGRSGAPISAAAARPPEESSASETASAAPAGGSPAAQPSDEAPRPAAPSPSEADASVGAPPLVKPPAEVAPPSAEAGFDAEPVRASGTDAPAAAAAPRSSATPPRTTPKTASPARPLPAPAAFGAPHTAWPAPGPKAPPAQRPWPAYASPASAMGGYPPPPAYQGVRPIHAAAPPQWPAHASARAAQPQRRWLLAVSLAAAVVAAVFFVGLGVIWSGILTPADQTSAQPEPARPAPSPTRVFPSDPHFPVPGRTGTGAPKRDAPSRPGHSDQDTDPGDKSTRPFAPRPGDPSIGDPIG